MAIVRLVRHGRATGGWDATPDPGLDPVGEQQARLLVERLGGLGAQRITCSPMRRCRETAAPLAAAWGVEPTVEPIVSEFPSPPGVPLGERVPWLRAAMAGRWSDLGGAWTDYRHAAIDHITTLATDRDSVVISHFVAINAVIGACVGDDRLVLRRLDNTSVTVVEADAAGRLVLVEAGAEADTLIR
ncbi:MAG: histidine phosphatase family protein [Ilumatobacteraceae bacterium]